MTASRRTAMKAAIDVRVRELLAEPERVAFCQRCFEPFDLDPQKPRGGAPQTICKTCQRARKRESERVRQLRVAVGSA